eukprot:gene10464-8423_t
MPLHVACPISGKSICSCSSYPAAGIGKSPADTMALWERWKQFCGENSILESAPYAPESVKVPQLFWGPSTSQMAHVTHPTGISVQVLPDFVRNRKPRHPPLAKLEEDLATLHKDLNRLKEDEAADLGENRVLRPPRPGLSKHTEKLALLKEAETVAREKAAAAKRDISGGAVSNKSKGKGAGPVLLGKVDLNTDLTGAALQLLWPESGEWWSGEVTVYNQSTHSAIIYYATGEEEEVALGELVSKREDKKRVHEGVLVAKGAGEGGPALKKQAKGEVAVEGLSRGPKRAMKGAEWAVDGAGQKKAAKGDWGAEAAGGGGVSKKVGKGEVGVHKDVGGHTDGRGQKDVGVHKDGGVHKKHPKGDWDVEGGLHKKHTKGDWGAGGGVHTDGGVNKKHPKGGWGAEGGVRKDGGVHKKHHNEEWDAEGGMHKHGGVHKDGGVHKKLSKGGWGAEGGGHKDGGVHKKHPKGEWGAEGGGVQKKLPKGDWGEEDLGVHKLVKAKKGLDGNAQKKTPTPGAKRGLKPKGLGQALVWDDAGGLEGQEALTLDANFNFTLPLLDAEALNSITDGSLAMGEFTGIEGVAALPGQNLFMNNFLGGNGSAPW